MPQAVHETLISILSTHGNMDSNQASSFLAQLMKEGTYTWDVWS